MQDDNENILYIPEEHMEAVAQGLAESDAGLSRPMTADDWEDLRQLVRNVADRAAQESRRQD